MSDLFDYFLVFATFVGISYSIVESVILILERRRAQRIKLDNIFLPPISVFKPLKGIDNQLDENLRSFFKLDYPRYELIFGINDLDDPAIAEVKKLQREYPQIRSRLIVNEFRVGPNPKVNNLYNMYPYANYDYFIISDSNVRVDCDYLRRMAAEMVSEKVGLVTSVIRGINTNSIGSILENLHLNTFIASNIYTVKRLFNISITIGKSMLFRRETLERIGGIKVLTDYLAEDHVLGRKIANLGLEIRTASSCINTVNNGWKFGDFINRHLRWATMRRHVNIWHYLAEVFSNPILFALFYLMKNPDFLGTALFISVYISKSLIDLSAGKSMRADIKSYLYFLTPIKDLIIIGIWIVPFFNFTINWRGNFFIVSRNTRLTCLNDRNVIVKPTFGSAYSMAFRNSISAGSLSLVQRAFWFTGLAGQSMVSGTRRLIERVARV